MPITIKKRLEESVTTSKNHAVDTRLRYEDEQATSTATYVKETPWSRSNDPHALRAENGRRTVEREEKVKEKKEKQID